MSDADFVMQLRTKAKHYKMVDGRVARMLMKAADKIEAAHEPVVDCANIDLAAELEAANVSLLPWQKKRLGIK